MFQRSLSAFLTANPTKAPIITLLGPRQSGKTTLVRTLFRSHQYVSLEEPDIRLRAQADPRGFLSTHEQVILDEVQRAPELLSYLQTLVDNDSRPNRYVLTGSENILLSEKIAQTLAGRTLLATLLPLSITELQSSPPVAPDTLTSATFVSPESQSSVWKLIYTGLYPRIHDKHIDPTVWLADYVRTYVERDLQGVMRLMDLTSFQRFMQLVAARTATELNLSELAADVGVTQPTAKAWLSALEVSYLIALIPPHHKNFRKRLRKRPKLHLLDTGLACYLLGIRNAEQLATHPLRGALFESYIAGELFKAFFNRGERPSIYHWRDASGREIDFVLDLPSGLLPIEAKSSMTLPSDAFKTLQWWLDLPGNTANRAVVVFAGSEGYHVERIAVVPWHFHTI